MRFLQWLFGRTPDHSSDPPPIILRTTHDRAPMQDERMPDAPEIIVTITWDDEDDEDIAGTAIEATAVAPAGPVQRPAPRAPATLASEPLENLYCEIEYSDATGQVSRRPITMLSFKRSDSAAYIHALCHLRKAQRTFRCDRIVNIITVDGEVFEGQHFLREYMAIDLTVSLRQEPVARADRPAPKPAVSRNFRDLIIAPMTVLVACGKADGRFHVEEVDRVMAWAEKEAMHLHRAGLIDADLTLEEAEALGRTITGMRPQARTLRRHIGTTLMMDPAALARFRRALIAVIDADGTLHDAELQFITEFDELAAIAAGDQNAVKSLIGEAAKGMR